MHAILREFDGDFGRDLLAEHYAREHARVRVARAPRSTLSTGAPAATQSRKPPSSATALAKPIWRSVAAASVEIFPNSQ